MIVRSGVSTFPGGTGAAESGTTRDAKATLAALNAAAVEQRRPVGSLLTSSERQLLGTQLVVKAIHLMSGPR